MKFTSLLNGLFAVVIILISSCTSNELIDPNKEIPDPDGTMILDISNAKIDNKIYMKDGNLTGALFINIGEVKGLGNVASIPKEGWVNTVALMEGYGYIAWSDNKYYRIYGHILNDHQTVVKYQYPFLGAELSIKFEKNIIFSKEGGEKIIELENKTLLPFTISCQESWISAKVVASEPGNPYNAISIKVSANSTVDSRNGIIQVQSEVGEHLNIQIEQVSGDAVLYVDPTSLNFDGIASSETIYVSSNTEYSIESSEDWCKINGKVISVSENATGANRKAIVTISTKNGNVTKTISVLQKKLSLVISKTDFNLAGSKATESFTVNSSGVSSWDATSNSNWCSVSKSGNTVNFAVSQNNSGKTRTAVITILFPGTTGTVCITQDIPTLSISESNFFYDWRKNNGEFIVDSNISDWDVSCEATWISINRQGEIVKFAVAENSSDSRSANIITSLPDGRHIMACIDQSAMPSPFIDAEDQEVAADETSLMINVKSNIKWQVSVSDGITLLSDSVCDKDGLINISLIENKTQNINTYYVYITPIDSRLEYLKKEIKITQRKVGRYFLASASDLIDGDVFVFVCGKEVGAGLYRNDFYHTITLRSCTISGNEITEMPANTVKIKVIKDSDGYTLMALNASYGEDFSGKCLIANGNYRLDFSDLEMIEKYSYPKWKYSGGNFTYKWDSSEKYYLMAYKIGSNDVYEITCRTNSSTGRSLSIYKFTDTY